MKIMQKKKYNIINKVFDTILSFFIFFTQVGKTLSDKDCMCLSYQNPICSNPKG